MEINISLGCVKIYSKVPMKKVQKQVQKKLLLWFEKHHRDLPWRNTKDPYRIWISEVMLQQTTSKAVIPYYTKFLKRFPTIKSLSQAKKADVFPLWTGLGYYRRAENLIKAAKKIKNQKHFPKNHKELLLLPGFGPYTARAVSSLAFKESVGVLDGNVIRVLSRFYGQALKWWEASSKNQLQNLADLWVQQMDSSLMNQALMELGSLVCIPKNPLCLICPLMKYCKAFKSKIQNELPLKKTKKEKELWYWQPEIVFKNSKLAFTKHKNIPFLKDKIMFPGTIKKLKSKPKKYHFCHSIMHYQIFVNIKSTTVKKLKEKPIQWFTQKQATKLNPSSLIQKILKT